MNNQKIDEEIRQYFFKHEIKLTDEEIIQIRDFLIALARIAVETHKENQQKNNRNKKKTNLITGRG